MKATKRQLVARTRNWNKRMLRCAAYALRVMVDKQSNGLLAYESRELNKMADDMFAMLREWKKSIN